MTRALPLALLLLLAVPAPAQEPEPLPLAERRRAVREGTHVFRRILGDLDVTALDSFEALGEAPARNCILIVLGDLDQIDKIPGGLDKFVRSGGAVLLASDRPVTSRTARAEMLRVTGVTINSETVVCTNRGLCYKFHDFCPYLVWWGNRGVNLWADSGTGNAPRLPIATNTPSMLLPRRGALPTMATLPLDCFIETPEGLIPAVPDLIRNFAGQVDPQNIHNCPAFMVGGNVDDGRALVLADHSVFINEMMMPRDTHNVEMTYAALRWLQGENKTRDQVLFVEEGVIQTRFDLPVRSGALPAEEALRLLWARRNAILAATEEKLTQLEDQAFYDNAVIDWLARRGLPPSRLAQLAAAIGAGVLFLFLLLRLGFRHRFRHDTTTPSLVVAVSGNFPARPLADQRHHALLRGRNLAEPAAALVRQWFARQGIDVPAGAAAPAFSVRGGWRRRRRAKRLQALWELANGQSARPVSPPEMWQLQRELEDLAAARAEGEWSLPRRPGVSPPEVSARELAR